MTYCIVRLLDYQNLIELQFYTVKFIWIQYIYYIEYFLLSISIIISLKIKITQYVKLIYLKKNRLITQ